MRHRDRPSVFWFARWRDRLQSTALTTLVIVLTTSGSPVGAQTITGTLGGQIEDESGRPLPGATVTVVHIQTGFKYACVTDTQGEWLLPSLVPGRYSLSYEAKGYRRRGTTVTVEVNRRLRIFANNRLQRAGGPSIARRDLTPPTLVVRGFESETSVLHVKEQRILLYGEAHDDSGISYVIVDGAPVDRDSDGSFVTGLTLRSGAQIVCVTAIDVHGNWTRKLLTIVCEAEPSDADDRPLEVNLSARKYEALVIGENEYTHLPALRTAVGDATAVAAVLSERYGFSAKVLQNASRNEIISAIDACRRRLNPGEDFLIFYAGHGYYDKDMDKAYWLPTDAKANDVTNWISADDVTSLVRGSHADHVLVVSDSCYSGALARGIAPEARAATGREQFLRQMLSGKSRTLLASGGKEPVSDGGGDGHSVFAAALLKGLAGMRERSFTARELFSQFIEQSVSGSAEQVPEYDALRNSGHEAGDFVFCRR